MSKSLGNVVDPFKVLESFPSEVIRSYMAFQGPEDFDIDFDSEALPSSYNILVEGFGTQKSTAQ